MSASARELGFHMPAEWETHEATWLAWPHNPTDWPDKLDTIRWVYAEIVRKIAPGETVRMLVESRGEEKLARTYLKRAGADAGNVEFIVHPTNRGWMRDSGPVFVRRAVKNGLETAIVHFHFNAWAKYPDWRKDRKAPETAAARLKKRLFDAQIGQEGRGPARRGGVPASPAKGTGGKKTARATRRPFVLEGGGIDVNGRGSLITTEECYLDPVTQVRNPGLSREGFEAAVGEWLGAGNVLWLPGGVTGDDTHGHVDDICRFVNAKTLALIREKNARDENYRALCENWERVAELQLEDGARPEVIALPMPQPLFFDGYRLPASYANFYIANAAVLVPTFNDPNDRVALGILGELFPDREVVGIHAVDLVLGFGTLHCLTQQQPAEARGV